MPAAQPDPDAMWRAVNTLSEHADHLVQREQWTIGTALTGRECVILGTRARLRIEWPDGPPPGMTQDDLRAIGEQMLPPEEAGERG